MSDDLDRAARRLGRAGIQQLSQSLRAGGLRNAFGGEGGLRRMRQDDEPDDSSDS